MSLEPHRWAVVSTIKAPTKDILNFAAHYLHLGATHLYLFLDFPDPDAQENLEQNEGVAGLKRLHRELCLATPELVARLDQYDLYRLYDFNFDAKRAQYFPQFSI